MSSTWSHSTALESQDQALRLPAGSSITITGATGFIGLNLAESLTAQGHHVRCLVRNPGQTSTLNRMDCELVKGDVQDAASLAAAVANVDYVIHLAGMTAALSNAELFRVNEQGAGNVAAACARCETPPTLLHISSIAAAGPTALGTVRLESDPPAPISNYGRSKLAGERSVRNWASEMPITILRPGVVFGPRDHGMLSIYKAIQRGMLHVVPVWNPPPLSYIFVDDLCDVMERAAAGGERLLGIFADELRSEQYETGEADAEELRRIEGTGVYFAVTSEHPNYAELGRMLRQLLHRPWAPIVTLPGVLPWFIAATNEAISQWKGRPNQLNRDKIREARASSWECSHKKCQQQLDFTPAYSLLERFEETIAWYRQAGWL